MQSLLLHLPEHVNTPELRTDLEEIIARFKGREICYFAFQDEYFVGVAKVYEIPGSGTIQTITNDGNVFCEKALHVPGGKLYYSAKILFTSFDEYSTHFKQLKENFEWLNTKYHHR